MTYTPRTNRTLRRNKVAEEEEEEEEEEEVCSLQKKQKTNDGYYNVPVIRYMVAWGGLEKDAQKQEATSERQHEIAGEKIYNMCSHLELHSLGFVVGNDRRIFLSSEAKLEVAVVKVIQTDAIPVLEKLHKIFLLLICGLGLILLPFTEERALKQQHRQEMLMDGFRDSGITRSCRNCRPVCYTFEDFDKAIKEAIQPTTKLHSEALREAITQISNDAGEKKRKFNETIELQIGLKNYAPQKDKHFSGSVRWSHSPRPKMKVCMLGDAQHVDKVILLSPD
ncbi:hypothetical protein RHMOL_Rhmol02G0184900 [Rhododendron molle]|uniref:Uncharacterized protein n=1 Tax=Rhododendron molle TaxID=49168 RepID=A0ACC0PRP3_RHOML|nr:hypothetical protein RHMOL_Rhmol02G0184900 [Rhododendron molle]